MGLEVTEYLRLSPGELERYTKEASREARLKRLQEARLQASAAAQQLRRSNELQRRVEEKALKTVEVRAELQAKRVQLEGLLKLKEVCHKECNAMESAKLQQVEEQARRCAAEAQEAERQKQEALRCLEACRQRKAWRSSQEEALQARRKQRQEVQATERRRAQRAAALGRATKEAQALVQQRHEHEEQATDVSKVLKTDVSGLQQLSQTCVKVLQDATLEAEEQPRRRPAPEPSPLQRQAARTRGLAAQQQLRAEREEKDAERQREAAKKKERQEKALALAARASASAWTDKLLPWRVLGTSKAAQHELSGILADTSSERKGPCWELPRGAASKPRKQRAAKAPKAQSTVGTATTVTWLGPAMVWPTVGVDEAFEDRPCPHDVQCKLEGVQPPEDLEEEQLDANGQGLQPRSDQAHQFEPILVASPGGAPVGPPQEDASDAPPPTKLASRLPAPRPTRQPTTRVGEEDLAMRLDDICRELEEVGLCAWEADEEDNLA